VLTSPPYGASVHGQVTAVAGRGVVVRNDRYTNSARGSGNLAHASDDGLLGLVRILAAARVVLQPSGIVVITARPWRRNGILVDFPAAIATAAERAGLRLLERNVALLAGLRRDRLVSRASVFQLMRVRIARAGGVPLGVFAAEDVLVDRLAPPR
jgi:modification methylase